MTIKATRTSPEIMAEGHDLSLEPVRKWCFHTNQQTVWRSSRPDWKSRGLIEFVFEDADQDYDEFRNPLLGGPVRRHTPQLDREQTESTAA
ncbi:hypothetical protein A5710_11975 [Mycolicibacter sinensis]|uniref:Uncharacterized protein n=1 Tax=Mycolicibacter sinensis (strain JDM601) TaxID=875328 RepID=A0A1A2YAF2_MYCSD|nr:hypothetical protein A5710_11975 [Mycolicibacter sinensis]